MSDYDKDTDALRIEFHRADRERNVHEHKIIVECSPEAMERYERSAAAAGSGIVYVFPYDE